MDDKQIASSHPKVDSPDGVSDKPYAQIVDSDTAKRLRWAFRKVDATLILVLLLANVLNSMDRSNLGLSKVAGLEKDTGMHGSDFNVVVSLMYPTYLLFMLPSNLVLRKVGARIWLSLITIIWGVINMCMAFAKSKTDLILCRLFLGMAESGATPGGLMLITLWYPRELVTSRISFFFSSFAIGAIVGGPIASGIMNIDSPRFKSWQWIFFIEGILTAGFGCIMYFLLADYPEKSWLLNASEKTLLKQRMEQDQMDGGHRPIDKSRLLVHVRDPLIYAQALIFYCVNFGSNTILTFSAIIVNQMGYSPSASQAMQAIPGLCGFIGILLSRYYPKWFGSHYAGALFVSGWIITASIILLATTSNGARIFALCLLAFGSFGAGGIGPGWVMSNVGGPTRSAVSGALNVTFGGLGALSASYIYQNHDAPRYLFGHVINLFAGLLAAITATVAYLIIRRRNKQKVTEPLDISHMTDREILSLENHHPDFRYVA
ncbi:hypothetical protein H4S02_001099 [Coemansia sp. RSA 2611]|nr:hypothetical protein H4S02_001099 [Coemansia sp. RSA 2611]